MARRIDTVQIEVGDQTRITPICLVSRAFRCYAQDVTTVPPELEFADQVLDSLQEHRSRDRVELVVDVGFGWSSLQPTMNELVKEGFVVVREIDGVDIFELSDSTASPAPAGIVAK